MSKLEIGIAVAAALAVVGLFFTFSNPFDFMALDDSLGQEAALGSAGEAAGDGGLIVQEQTVGSGAEAKTGDTVRVHYTGKFENGTVFDTSVGRAPFEFMLGAGDVIPGWDVGLVGMRVGGKRTLIVPPELGYGAIEYGPIPGGSTLIFEVELVGVVSAGS